jgi:NAD(P)-dependent dehydrogenase (short-subunit alcohol dehydrogenase family)
MSNELNRLFGLEGRTIVITGGYGNIGRALVRGAIGCGANVAVIELRPSEKATADSFGDLANQKRLGVFAADVTDRSSLEAASDQIIERFGAPSALVNNAALDSPPDSPASENGPFEDYPAESWDKVMDVNVKGVFQCCQVFGRLMAEQGQGSIVNIASIYGSVSPDQSLYQYRRDRGDVFFKPVAYSASKSALYNLTRYLAVYWGPKGVRTNTLTFAGVFNNQDAEFLDNYERKIPLRRGDGDAHLRGMAKADDYVGPVMFLISDAAAYITGADLRVDGGFLAM